MAAAQLPLLFTALGVVLLIIFYAFYLNRVLAWLVAAGLRLRLWDPTSSPGSIHVSLEAVQFSLLSGRLLLKDLRYHSSNQSFRIVKMKITWKYWLWRTRQGIDAQLDNPGESDQARRYQKDSTLPCRIAVYIDGFEWFMYNRTWSYEDVLARMKNPTSEHAHEAEQHVDDPLHGVTSHETSVRSPPSRYVGVLAKAGQITGALWRWFSIGLPTLDWMELLPVGLRVERGAIILGNSSAPSIIVARFSSANGTFDVTASRCSRDPYKQVLNLAFKRVLVTCNANPDYDTPMLSTGRQVFEHVSRDSANVDLDSLDFTNFQTLLADYARNLKPGPPEPDPKDYAHWEQVLSTNLLAITYYSDVAGKMVEPSGNGTSNGKPGIDVGNGDLPPQWGVEMTVHDAEVCYGPWTDRQRAELQRVFFPQTFHDAHLTEKLEPGETRLFVEMVVRVEFQGTTSLRLPFREPSKDWQYDAIGDPAQTKRSRRMPAWLDVKFHEGSTLHYSVPMVADESGYLAKLEFNMSEATVAGLDRFEFVFLKADACKVVGNMPTPLHWKAHREWHFDISFEKPNIHLLRDHVTLVTDLIKDWVSGPPSDPRRFVPMTYSLTLDLANFDIVLYLNDHNIVDQLFEQDKNGKWTLLTLSGGKFTNKIAIPSHIFRPESSTVPFSIQVPDLALSLTLPKWNTHSLFATRATTDIGRIKDLDLKGSFFYFSEVREDFVDRLHLGITASRIMLKSFGWVIRHFMILKDNYFGAFTNQSTTHEYRHTKDSGRPVGDPVEAKFREGKSNIFEVVVDVQVTNALMVMPAGLTGSEGASAGNKADDLRMGHAVVLAIPELGLALRLHDYFMEMSLNIQPVAASIVRDAIGNDLWSQGCSGTPDILLIDGMYVPCRIKPCLTRVLGIYVTGNRLFGPNPRNATYLCLWEIQVGAIKSALSIHDAMIISSAVNSFRTNYSDVVNSPAAEYAIASDPDVTFLKVTLASVDVACKASRACLHASLAGGLELSMNDMAGKTYRRHIGLRVPVCILRCLVSVRDDAHHWLEAAALKLDVFIDVYQAPTGWAAHARAQREYVATQDAPTRRAPFLYQSGHEQSSRLASYCSTLFLPHPQLPVLDSPPEVATTHVSSHASFGRLSRMADSPRTRRSAVEELRDHSGDDDEDISEADRDARIARSRPVTPRSTRIAYVDVDNDSMSSGDESDDGDDSLDELSSDSEWSDGEDDASSSARPNIASYIKLVSHYRVAPSLAWDAPLLAIEKNPTLSKRAAESPHGPIKLPEDAASPSWIQSSITNLARTVVRLRTDEQIDFSVSPLLVQFVDSLIRAQEVEEPSFELVVDQHILGTLATVLRKDTPSSEQLVLDLEISSFRLWSTQRIMSADESLAYWSKAAPKLPTQSQVVSIFDVQLSRFGLLAETRIPTDPHPLPIQRMLLRYDSLSVCLRAAQSHVQSGMNRSSRALTTEVEAHAGPFRLSFTSGRSSLQAGDFVLKFQQRSSEAVIGTAACIVRSIRQISARRKDREMHIQKWFRRFVVLSMTVSRHKPGITDPLSQAQPSFLLHSGHPIAIRADALWRFLLHLRYTLRFFSNDERASLRRQCEFSADIQDDDVRSVHEVLQRRLGEWSSEADDEGPYWTPLYALLRPETQTPSGMHPSSPSKTAANSALRALPLSFTLTTGTVSMSLLHSDDLANDLVTGPVHMSFNRRDCSLITQTNATTTSLVSANRSARDIALPSPTIVQLYGALDFHSIHSRVSPTLIPFALHLLRMVRGFAGEFKPVSRASDTREQGRQASLPSGLQVIRAEMAIRFRDIVFSASAQHIALQIRLHELRLAAAISMSVQLGNLALGSLSSSAAINFQQLELAAKDLRHAGETSVDARDILASLVFTDASLSCGAATRNEQSPKLHGAFSLGGLQLSIPRSVMRLYKLIDEWRVQFLPDLEQMIQSLVSELDRKPKAKSRVRVQTPSSMVFDLHALLTHMRVTLHVMHGTWLCWDFGDVIGHIQNSRGHASPAGLAFGLEIGGQKISVGSSCSLAEEASAKLSLPSCRVSGTSDDKELSCRAVVDDLRVTFKPKHMDDILAIQQKFGSDFNDLLDLVAETRRNRPAALRRTPVKDATPWHYDVSVNMTTVRLGIAGRSTVQYFIASNVTGGMTNLEVRKWHLSISNVGLCLVHNSPDRGSPFELTSALAYILLDVRMTTIREDGMPDSVQIDLPRLHAVMQPSSIGELGDLVDYIQAEMLAQAEKRAAEIAEIRSKTKKILRAWDIRPRNVKAQEPSALFDNRVITLTVSNLGVAFPLSHDGDIALQEMDRHASISFTTSAVPAFLFSIESMEFRTKRYEAGAATITGFAFQFVSSFDQALPSEFSDKTHQQRGINNRLIYPGLKAEVRSRTSGATRTLHVSGSVDGFTLDLDPTIAPYVFSLVDVYRQGKERLQRMAPVQEDIAAALPRASSEPTPQHTRLAAIPTSHVRLKLNFASGRVRLHGPGSRAESKPRDNRYSDPTRDVFNLPELSVWMEYKATAAAKKFGAGSGDDEPSTLVFSAVIHKSNNSLRPTLLPFVTELGRNIEARMKRRDSRHFPSPKPGMLPALDAAPTASSMASPPAAIGSMQIHFSLRIDESALRLTCFPDVSILSGLYWKSGGFMLTVAPGARKIGLTGSIAGVTAELRHEYIKEVFFQAQTQNLAFAVAFSKARHESGEEANSVSIVVDTELTASVDFRRLQDGYCFKAVWLDRLPVFESASTQRREGSIAGLLSAPASKPVEEVPFSTLILVRSRRLALTVDLAQAAAMTLDLQSVVIRTHLSQTLADISMSFADLSLKSERLVCGRATLPEFSFQTLRKRRPAAGSASSEDVKMLQLSLLFGRLEISLLHGGEHKVFHYEADPVRIHVFDDWARAGAGKVDEQQLSLNFEIVGTSISLAVGLAIARKVLEIQDKIKNLFRTQRDGALRDSQAFRSTWSPAPANPLSDVANAMIMSARTRFKEHSDLSYVVVQKMVLELARLKINVFPTFMTDDSLATFQGIDLLARLERVVAAEDVPHHREMMAAFSSVLMSKFTGLPRDRSPLPSGGDVGSNAWLEALVKNSHEDVIISIPSMNVKMVSDEKQGGSGPRSLITYRFDSQFVKSVRAVDSDIYVTLNYTHYTWLTSLKKTVEREIAQFKREKAISAAAISASRAGRDDRALSPPTSPILDSKAKHTTSPSMAATAPAIAKPSQDRMQYIAEEVHIETPLLRQLGEATPSLDSTWVQSLSGIKFRERFPQYLHEFATVPLEEMMKMLLELYSKQLKRRDFPDSPSPT
ncbi:hypothetical protein AURDEDRAFT_165486 [Auricularia subglabra TFB-10046 SS5]|nr:hypothetical protein AURDEDRAFT_165486 [Auricularia subglabra TFB-10046 SS5]